MPLSSWGCIMCCLVSILLAGFAPIGIGGGNIIESGTKSLCTHYEENFEQILKRLR